MAPLRGLKTCAKLKGVDFVHVGTLWGTGAQPIRPGNSYPCLRGLQTTVRDCPRQGQATVRPLAVTAQFREGRTWEIRSEA
jgi:hypothetical protein